MAARRNKASSIIKPRKSRLARVVGVLVGLLLIPVALAFSLGLVTVLLDSPEFLQPFGQPSPFWALAIGCLLWLGLYGIMPRPVRAYVLAHELTHAFWAWLYGDRVRDVRISSSGGSVRVDRPRFLVFLAPYFFPLYTVLVLAAYGAAAMFGDPTPWTVWWLAAIGFTWGFHLTFTISALMQGQSDIQAAGPLPAYVAIYLLNLVGIAAWISAVSPLKFMDIALRSLAFLMQWAAMGRALLARTGA